MRIFTEPRDMATRLILIILSSAFTLYLFEAALVVLDSAPPKRGVIAKERSIPFDTRSKLQVIKDLELEGIEAYPNYHPSFLVEKNETLKLDGREVLPLGGISGVVSVSCNETGEYLIFRSDEHGFHNPKGLYERGLEIAIVGDSIAEGVCVSSDQNAAAFLREEYGSVLNLGTSGTGPLLMLATLKEYGLPFEPKIVLWFYSEGTDLGDIHWEKEIEGLTRYLERDYKQDLLSIPQSQIDEELKEMVRLERLKAEEGIEWDRWRRFFSLYRLRNLLGFSLLYLDHELDKEDFELFRQTLISARDLTASSGGELYFVYLPEWRRFNDPKSAAPHREQVLNIVDELDIPVIDVAEAFASHEDPLSLFPFRMNGHYNVEGYRLVAETISEFIDERQESTTVRTGK